MDINSRLNNVIEKDKKINPKYISNVIKSDIYYLINNYFEVEFDDIECNIEFDDKAYKISIKCKGDRMKIMKVLPT